MRSTLLFAPVFGLLLLAGCGGGSAGSNSKDVGGICKTDQDCNHRCTTEDTFGGGMCTIACATDNDCPSGAVCVTKDGGICAVSCGTDQDCSSFGRGWICGQMSRKSGGDTNICRLP